MSDLKMFVFSLAMNNYRFNGGGKYMEAMGFDAAHKPQVLFDSQKEMGDDGQIREMIGRYIQEQGVISPKVDHNWKTVEK